MVQLGEEKGLTNEETVTCSQELDQLLLVYQKQRLKEEEEKTSFATLISRFYLFKAVMQDKHSGSGSETITLPVASSALKMLIKKS